LSVVFDATHSVQLPGGRDGERGSANSCGTARAAVASGVSGCFMETHPIRTRPCRTAQRLALAKMRQLLMTLKELDRIVKKSGFVEQSL